MKIDQLYQIADELRGIANLGLRFGKDDYDRERYEKVLFASARIVGLLNDNSSTEVMAAYQVNFAHVSPLAGAEAVVCQDDKILLIRRQDDGLWAVPGGLVEVGEMLAEAAQRELLEEAGVRAEITNLLAIFDSRVWKTRTSMQLYHFVFRAEANDPEPHPGPEALDAAYFSEDNLPELSLGHRLRTPYLFRIMRGEVPVPHFDIKTEE
jgi:ADP-ribose pyrophosphatase YjhB (NUDIX family)